MPAPTGPEPVSGGPVSHGRDARQHRSRFTFATAAALIITAGLLCRWPGAGLPWPVAKWSGSILWGTMVYTLVALIRPGAALGANLAFAAAIALTVEFSRLWHPAWLDAFRNLPIGAILLGRIFSYWNIAAYAVGIFLGAAADARWVRAPDRQRPT